MTDRYYVHPADIPPTQEHELTYKSERLAAYLWRVVTAGALAGFFAGIGLSLWVDELAPVFVLTGGGMFVALLSALLVYEPRSRERTAMHDATRYQFVIADPTRAIPITRPDGTQDALRLRELVLDGLRFDARTLELMARKARETGTITREVDGEYLWSGSHYSKVTETLALHGIVRVSERGERLVTPYGHVWLQTGVETS